MDLRKQKTLSEILEATKKDAEDYVKNPPTGYRVGGFPTDNDMIIKNRVDNTYSSELWEKYEKFHEKIKKLEKNPNDETLEEFKKVVDEMIKVANQYEK